MKFFDNMRILYIVRFDVVIIPYKKYNRILDRLDDGYAKIIRN